MVLGVARLFTFFLLIVGALAPRRALSEPQRATLSLTREPGASACIDEAELGRQIDALAGTAVVVDSASVAVSVSIRPAESGFLAHIVLTGKRSGERTLDDPGPGCDVLGRALVVTVAILLDAGPAARIEPAPPPPAPAKPLDPAKGDYFDMPAVPPAPASLRRREPLPLLATSASAIFDVGTLVDEAGGFSMGADFWIPHFGLGAHVVVLPFDRLQVSSRVVDYRYVAARVQLCSKPPFDLPFGITVCSGLAAGERGAELRGSDAPSTSGAFVAFETRLEVSARVAHDLGVFASTGFAAPLLAEPIDVVPPQRTRAIQGPDATVTFQSALGVRFWLDL
jgi:hypothetical protein